MASKHARLGKRGGGGPRMKSHYMTGDGNPKAKHLPPWLNCKYVPSSLPPCSSIHNFSSVIWPNSIPIFSWLIPSLRTQILVNKMQTILNVTLVLKSLHEIWPQLKLSFDTVCGFMTPLRGCNRSAQWRVVFTKVLPFEVQIDHSLGNTKLVRNIRGSQIFAVRWHCGPFISLLILPLVFEPQCGMMGCPYMAWNTWKTTEHATSCCMPWLKNLSSVWGSSKTYGNLHSGNSLFLRNLMGAILYKRTQPADTVCTFKCLASFSG